SPEVVLDATAHVQPHRDGHHVDRQRVEHAALQGEHGAVGCGADEVGQVVDVGRVHAAADGYPVHDQRSLVDAAADHALDGLEGVDVVELERALYACGVQASDVFLGPAWTAGNG